MFLNWEFPLCKQRATATVTAGIGSGGMLARVTAALGGRDLATVIRSHNGEERLLEHSLLTLGFPGIEVRSHFNLFQESVRPEQPHYNEAVIYRVFFNWCI